MLTLADLVQLIPHSESIEVHSSVPLRIGIYNWVWIFWLNLSALPKEKGAKHHKCSDCHQEIFEFPIEPCVVFLLFGGELFRVKVRLLSMQPFIHFLIELVKESFLIIFLPRPWIYKDLIGLQKLCITTIRSFVTIVLIFWEEASIRTIDLLNGGIFVNLEDGVVVFRGIELGRVRIGVGEAIERLSNEKWWWWGKT